MASKIVTFLQELWGKLHRRSRATKSEEPHTDFEAFTLHVDQTSRDAAKRVTTLSVKQTESKSNLMKYNPEVPLSLGRFIHLSSLTITGCCLEKLPWSCVYLQQLKYLDISKNNFQYFPSFVCGLHHLHTLNVQWNKLVVLPTALVNLKQLQKLLVDGNTTLESPDYQTCMLGQRAIFNHICKRGEHGRNLWANSRRMASPLALHTSSETVPSLFHLATNTITTFEVDFYTVSFVPPRLISYLSEEKDLRNDIQVAKCSVCSGYFSNVAFFEAHSCKTRQQRHGNRMRVTCRSQFQE